MGRFDGLETTHDWLTFHPDLAFACGTSLAYLLELCLTCWLPKEESRLRVTSCILVSCSRVARVEDVMNYSDPKAGFAPFFPALCRAVIRVAGVVSWMNPDLPTSPSWGFQESSGSLEPSNRHVLANLYLAQPCGVSLAYLLGWIAWTVIPPTLGSHFKDCHAAIFICSEWLQTSKSRRYDGRFCGCQRERSF